MSFKGYQKSHYDNNSPKNVFANDQGRNSAYNSPITSTNPSTSLPGWGTPAVMPVGHSPRGNRSRGTPYNQYSPRGNSYTNNGPCNSSPRGQNFSQNRSYNNSPRNTQNTPNSVTNNRFSSPNDVFKTPQSPLNRSYSSPASYSGFSSGNRQYNQRYQQVDKQR